MALREIEQFMILAVLVCLGGWIAAEWVFSSLEAVNSLTVERIYSASNR